MKTNSGRERPASDAFAPIIELMAPLIEAIAEAIVRKMEERRRIDEVAQAVLQRMREMGDVELGIALAGVNGESPSLSESEVFQLIRDVLSDADAVSENYPSRDATEGNPSDELPRPIAQ